MADCNLVIPYGISEAGAKEVSFNSGRELFRCGTGCVNMYITNVSMENNLVKTGCGDINSDVVVGSTMCLQSAQLNWKDQAVVNWEAKNDVTTALASGTVITVAKPCAGGDAAVYTHTEGQMSVRMQADMDAIAGNAALLEATQQQIQGIIIDKCNLITTPSVSDMGDLEWIFSDIGTTASATDWQGGSMSYIGFGFRTINGDDESFRFSFNWQNGRAEYAKGNTFYDEDPAAKPLSEIISDMLALYY